MQKLIRGLKNKFKAASFFLFPKRKTAISNIVNLPNNLHKLAVSRNKVSIELNLKCNANCIFCSRDASKENLGFSLDPEEVKDLIDSAKNSGALLIEFSGGEALLDPHLPDYLDYTHSLGMQTQLITNTLGFSSLSLCQTLLPKLDFLEMSIPCLDEETYNRLIGRNAYSQLIRALENVKNSECQKQLFVIVLKSTLPFLLNTLEFFKDFKNLNSIALMYPYLGGRLFSYPEEYLSFSEINPYIGSFLKRARDLHISVACGNAPLCAFFPYENLIFVDSKETSYKKNVARKYSDESISTYKVESLLLDRVKYPQCDNCIYKESCYGVREEYKILFNDIEPITQEKHENRKEYFSKL